MRDCSFAKIFVTFVFTLVFTAAAGAGQGDLPRSALPGTLAVEEVQRFVLPEVDTEKLLAEDALRENTGLPVPSRFAENIPASITPATGGTWEELEAGSKLWRIRIASPGALSLSLAFDRFDLPVGASLWVHDVNGANVQGPYTSKNRNTAGGLWTAVVPGDELVAEMYVPAGNDAEIAISSINHGYRFFGESDTDGTLKRGSCNINVVCPEGDPWRNQIRSVARITVSCFDGTSSCLCTGQMVNNTAENNIPYFLTAQHCIESESDAPSIVAYWNFQSPTCNDFSGGSLSENQSGSTWISSYSLDSGSDFTLVELDQSPDPSWNVYFSGWDARDQTPESTTTIHHPSGDQKSISFDYEPPTITSYDSSLSPGNGFFWRIADWDEATTEGGSSGAGLFDDATGRCIGTLSGGYAACGNDDPDWYGRFASHWTGDGTSETRLSDWLDPLNSGVLFLDGKNGPTFSELWLIPAVASIAGVPPTYWSSQVTVVNPTDATRSAAVYFVENGEEWPGELLSGPHTIASNATLYLEDPLQGKSPATGLLYVAVDAEGAAVFCRTSTPAPGGGSYGQGQPGILLSSASSTTELILPLLNSAPGKYRSNVGFAQTSEGSYRVLVEIYSAAGSLLAQTEFQQKAAWRQVNDIFKTMGIANSEVEGGWARITLVYGSPSFWTTYATVIDDSTGDPTYVLPVAP